MRIRNSFPYIIFENDVKHVLSNLINIYPNNKEKKKVNLKKKLSSGKRSLFCL
jgi:hypothetical protein